MRLLRIWRTTPNSWTECLGTTPNEPHRLWVRLEPLEWKNYKLSWQERQKIGSYHYARDSWSIHCTKWIGKNLLARSLVRESEIYIKRENHLLHSRPRKYSWQNWSWRQIVWQICRVNRLRFSTLKCLWQNRSIHLFRFLQFSYDKTLVI